MSASGIVLPHGVVVIRDERILAPRFRAGVDAALEECHGLDLDAVTFETYRTNELQGVYYERGRTVKPPEHPVTNARTNLYSWHGFALAVDVISKSEGWFNPAAKPELRLLDSHDPKVQAYVARGQKWFADVAAVFKRHDCKWGGDWLNPDPPHMQWWRCKPTPSDLARQLLAQGGLERVWQEVGAAA